MCLAPWIQVSLYVLFALIIGVVILILVECEKQHQREIKSGEYYGY